MAYGSVAREDIFKRLGTYIKWWSELEGMKDTLDSMLDNAIAEFELSSSPTAADKEAYEAFSVEIRRQKEELESFRQSVVLLVSDFFGVNVKDLLDSPYSTPESVLDHLIDEMGDYDSGGEQVLQNNVTIDNVDEDEDNSVDIDNSLLDFGMDVTQMAYDDQFALTCIDDTVVDSERWTLESARLGQYSGEIVTGQSVDWEQAGIEGLDIPAAPIVEDQDSDNKVSDWQLSGAIRGTNVASDGTAYLKFSGRGDLNNTLNDELGQIVIRSFQQSGYTAIFGAESDIDGNMYVSLVQDPASPEVIGGVLAEVSTTDLIIDGADDSNTDDGTLYAKIIKTTSSSTSTYTIELYSNSDRSTGLVATATDDTSAEDDVPDNPIELIADNSSGLTGTIKLGSFESIEDGTDSTIQIKIPLYYVRIYRSSSRSDEDLVSEGFSYTAYGTAYPTPPAGSDFETTGMVAISYIQDNENIIFEDNFGRVDMYRADPDDPDTTEDDIVARAGGECPDNLLEDGVADLPFYEVNGSGLTDVTIDLAAVTVSTGYIAVASAGFTNDDKFTFSTTTDDDGRFQTFLRDNFGKTFPEASSGATEIDEAWATP